MLLRLVGLNCRFIIIIIIIGSFMLYIAYS